MAKIDVKMSEKDLVWVISSVSRYGRTALLEELEEKLRVLRRYEYPGHGKKRVLTGISTRCPAFSEYREAGGNNDDS